jgi:hypothetical protein
LNALVVDTRQHRAALGREDLPLGAEQAGYVAQQTGYVAQKIRGPPDGCSRLVQVS